MAQSDPRPDRERLDEMLRALVAATSEPVGERFFRNLVKHVAQALGVRYALVGELLPGGERVRTLAAWTGDRLAEDFEYALAGTPCENVVGKGACVYGEGVQALFPADRLLVEMRAESYCGIPLRDSSGVALGVLAVLDVAPLPHPDERANALLHVFAARAQAEMERLRTERRLEAIAFEWQRTFDSIDAPTLILDAAGRVVRLNHAAVLHARRTYADVLGQEMGALGAAEPWPTAARLVATVREARAPATAEACDEAAGQTWSLFATVAAFDRAGHDERVILIARDVTPTVRLQESLRRTERMSAMGALVAGVAHEVRNPLFAISANLDALQADLAEGRPAEESLTVIDEAVSRLNRLMSDLLDWGGPAPPERTPGRLIQVLQPALRACEPLAQKAGVRVRHELAADLPSVSMDRPRLSQVFQNLLQNAIQHTPAEGVVTVLAREAGRWLEVDVNDEGKGFDAKDLPHVFEPFFTRRSGGTGLGLSIVQKIVEEHGGTVAATNRPQGGARLSVRLPIAGDTGGATEDS